jgi:hypothetical protein
VRLTLRMGFESRGVPVRDGGLATLATKAMRVFRAVLLILVCLGATELPAMTRWLWRQTSAIQRYTQTSLTSVVAILASALAAATLRGWQFSSAHVLC